MADKKAGQTAVPSDVKTDKTKADLRASLMADCWAVSRVAHLAARWDALKAVLRERLKAGRLVADSAETKGAS